MANPDKLLINLALKNNITTLENGKRLSPEHRRIPADFICVDKPITIGKLKEELSGLSDTVTFIIEDNTDYYNACINVYFDEVVPGVETLTEQERQYLENKIKEQTEQIKLDKRNKEKTRREQTLKEERAEYERLKKSLKKRKINLTRLKNCLLNKLYLLTRYGVQVLCLPL